ncbi:MOSC domain-containing protein [Pseudokineococcus marinus]|uniref:MOSC domain-containing protein n=1 Tax=Pseudokineococcus marinus TaxID=351215 RepID=A0A849BJJ0_9ACTN|nr:MOSC domain-containing protein [Pseudokineococcus marinus]NNH22791.1 MOSC domain-containing protein [Pseudokineococcus marinus]
MPPASDSSTPGSSPARVLAVCRVHQLQPDGARGDVTAIDKRPLDGAVDVGLLGVRGDVQADRQDHGGPDKAVYAYAQEEADHWTGVLQRELPPGLFGENLRTTGVDVDGAEVGERWRVGPRLEVEVTMARTPCQTFARHLGEERWVRRFTERGRPGAYLRVLVPGEVRAGDPVEVLSRPGHGVTTSAFFAERTPGDARVLRTAHDDGSLQLAPALLAYVDRALARP